MKQVSACCRSEVKESMVDSTWTSSNMYCSTCHRKCMVIRGKSCELCEGTGMLSEHIRPGEYRSYTCPYCSGVGLIEHHE